MFGNTIFEIDSQNERVLSNHLITNVDISKLATSTYILLIAALIVICYSVFNNIYVFYKYTMFYEVITFRAIPNYFKCLNDTQKIDMLDNETYYRSYGFTILDDKALKTL